jgi:hypothetical protein
MQFKNLLLLWCLLGIAIIVMSMNGFQLRPHPAMELADSVAGQALFVCPAADAGFESVAKELGTFRGGLSVAFTFFAILFAAVTAWAVYTSLLNDKFDKKNYGIPIFLGKNLLWVFILTTILLHTPNYFRRVFVQGQDGAWVLCERDTPGARAVKKDSLFSPGK